MTSISRSIATARSSRTRSTRKPLASSTRSSKHSPLGRAPSTPLEPAVATTVLDHRDLEAGGRGAMPCSVVSARGTGDDVTAPFRRTGRTSARRTTSKPRPSLRVRLRPRSCRRRRRALHTTRDGPNPLVGRGRRARPLWIWRRTQAPQEAGGLGDKDDKLDEGLSLLSELVAPGLHAAALDADALGRNGAATAREVFEAGAFSRSARPTSSFERHVAQLKVCYTDSPGCCRSRTTPSSGSACCGCSRRIHRRVPRSSSSSPPSCSPTRTSASRRSSRSTSWRAQQGARGEAGRLPRGGCTSWTSS